MYRLPATGPFYPLHCGYRSTPDANYYTNLMIFDAPILKFRPGALIPPRQHWVYYAERKRPCRGHAFLLLPTSLSPATDGTSQHDCPHPVVENQRKYQKYLYALPTTGPFCRICDDSLCTLRRYFVTKFDHFDCQIFKKLTWRPPESLGLPLWPRR